MLELPDRIDLLKRDRRDTRGHELKLRKDNYRRDFKKNSFPHRVIDISNGLDREVTSFLNVILGELPAHIGRVFVQGKISYASQEPWVFSGTVRKNIVFCLPFNEKKYLEVIKGMLFLDIEN
ncbi:putative multidrug resistance-associated protein [Portunus trituberculatus]|uniref:Putative multidrug resistance-associated protein n=1 Tax=Portunus trituberculatus TaxID=210409 RepID=A0A5B7I7E5_PORTR|nr:putative multidrug resistance-associated protein [Portunus trituberculatus]